MKIEDIKPNSDISIDSYKGIQLPPNLYKAKSPFDLFVEHQRTRKLRLFSSKQNEKTNFLRNEKLSFLPKNFKLTIVLTLKKVRLFINTLKLRMGYKNYKNLKINHLNVIDDMAVFQMNEENYDLTRNSKFLKKIKQPFLKKIKEKIPSFILNIPLFSRNNKLLLIWDALIFLISIFFMILIPIIFSFDNQGQNILVDEFIAIKKVAQVFFTLDFILKFNISYFDHGNVVKERSKIIKNYLKSDFLFDVFSLIGIFSDGSPFLKLLVLLKIISFSEYINVLRHLIILNDFTEGIIKIIVLISKIIYIAHILACLFNLISNELIKNNYSSSSWLVESNLIDKPWTEKYFNAFYWAIATLTTVGYGDIVPRNNVEKLFCIVVMLIGSGIFAYNINKLSNIFGDISKNEREYLQNLKVLNQMMKRKKLNSELQNKVRNYFHYMYKKENKKQIEEENQLFNKLSKGLQSEIILNSYASILKQSDFFCNNFSEEFLQNIVFTMKAKVCMPDEEIFVTGEIDNKMYFLTQGKARIYFDNERKEKSEKTIYDINAGETLCEMNLITTEEYKYCCKTTDFCTVYTISLKDFLKTLSLFPEDKEKYYMIKDSILLYKNYEYFYKKCKLCDSTFHLTEKCNYVTFQAQEEKILYKVLLESRNSIDQRKEFIRRNMKFKRYYIPEINSVFELPLYYPLHRRFSSPGQETSLERKEIKLFEGKNEDKFILSPIKDYHDFKAPSDTFEKGEIALLRNLVQSQPQIDLNYKSYNENNDSSLLDTSDNNQSKLLRLVSRNNDRLETKIEIEKMKKRKIGFVQEPLFNFSFEAWKNFNIYFPYNNFSSLMRKYRFQKGKEEEIDFIRKSTRKKTITKAQKRLFKSDYLNEL